MVFVAVEVSPVGNKPPVADVVHIFKGERHDLGAAVPLSTRTFSLEQGSAGSPVQSSPELVNRTGRDQPGWQNSYPHALLVLP